jgi:CcmD family protein
MKRLFLFVVSLFLGISNTIAQISDDTSVEMADQMRAEGKIYVVVAVVLIIFIGMILYLISLDRKITKLEKEKGSI